MLFILFCLLFMVLPFAVTQVLPSRRAVMIAAFAAAVIGAYMMGLARMDHADGGSIFRDTNFQLAVYATLVGAGARFATIGNANPVLRMGVRAVAIAVLLIGGVIIIRA